MMKCPPSTKVMTMMTMMFAPHCTGCPQRLFFLQTGKEASCTVTHVGEVQNHLKDVDRVPLETTCTGGSLERRNALDLPEEIEHNKEQAS